jgi:hypothetical protein
LKSTNKKEKQRKKSKRFETRKKEEGGRRKEARTRCQSALESTPKQISTKGFKSIDEKPDFGLFYLIFQAREGIPIPRRRSSIVSLKE